MSKVNTEESAAEFLIGILTVAFLTPGVILLGSAVILSLGLIEHHEMLKSWMPLILLSLAGAALSASAFGTLHAVLNLVEEKQPRMPSSNL